MIDNKVILSTLIGKAAFRLLGELLFFACTKNK